ncbi:hypothetical protein AURDEDRAFT_110671 [Auricularia subglabra TFB-10046 SS5]|nr:hypothetical protein AURDEDRAFT_110671 [Auricularia subglabra TFB-10046 SS5]
MTSTNVTVDAYGQRHVTRTPHPELYMSLSHNSGWVSERIESLYGMRGALQNPYLIFYPARQRSGAPIPVNTCISEIQGRGFRESNAWRGDVVVAKYTKDGEIMSCSAADFPLVKNYLALHYPQQ